MDEVPYSPAAVVSEVLVKPGVGALLSSGPVAVANKAMAVMIAVVDVTTILVVVAALAGKTTTSLPGTAMRPSTSRLSGNF